MRHTPLRRRTGFTFIELLTVVVIIGILASLAITKFGDSKKRAFYAAMKSDLKGLATMAETQFANENTYANFNAPLGSQGVTLTFTPNAQGWSAKATHTGLPGVQCTLVAGPGQNGGPQCN
ncbi:MAG: prepilin-type N-terminal cleavage/methylation domain-containing protein [Gemmatimonadaceae bacterium]|nr:prepilin-type N-terminal cleavage/methylation domain-containing protein [Gemmatimonadaceae bacterium]